MEYIRNLVSLRPAGRVSAQLITLLALSAAPSACDRSEDGSVRDEQCARFCQALEKCDDRTDVMDCEKHCGADRVRSDNYFKARADCAEQDACNQWASEVDSQGDDLCTGADCRLQRCVERKLADIDLSDVQERACTAISTQLVNCDSSQDRDAIKVECERMTPALTSSYVDESQRCIQESLCQDIQTCLNKLADREDTELRVFSGTLNR